MRKKFVAAALLTAVTIGGTYAQQQSGPVMPQDKTQSSPRLNAVQDRAKRLSDQMARDLHLNGYQATKLRTINEDKVAKMAAIEQRHAGNAKLIDQQCQGVCKERDQELRNVLTTTQYSAYYDSRADFYKYDRDYANQMSASGAALVKSVQNPLPASSKGAVIGPSRTTTSSQPAAGRGK